MGINGTRDDAAETVAAARDELFDDLVARAVTGDEQALDRLLRVLQPAVVRYCRGRLGGPGKHGNTADDVAQEVLMALLSALPRYRADQRRFMAFVYGIARNKVNDVFRSYGRDRSRPVAELPDLPTPVEDGPEYRALNAAEVDDLVELMAVLPVEQREILVLRVGLRLSSAETARTLGSTPGAVRVAQHRAVAKLKSVAADRALHPA